MSRKRQVPSRLSSPLPWAAVSWSVMLAVPPCSSLPSSPSLLPVNRASPAGSAMGPTLGGICGPAPFSQNLIEEDAETFVVKHTPGSVCGLPPPLLLLASPFLEESARWAGSAGCGQLCSSNRESCDSLPTFPVGCRPCCGFLHDAASKLSRGQCTCPLRFGPAFPEQFQLRDLALIEQADRSVCVPSLASRPCPHLLGLGWGLAQLPAMPRVSASGRTRGWRLLVVPSASCRPDLAFVAHRRGDTRIMRNTCTSEEKQPGKSPDSGESEPECEGTGARPASAKLAVLSFSA